MGDGVTAVLVKFPADVLALLDAEAKRLGVPRMAVIIARCRGDGSAPTIPEAPLPRPAPAARARAVVADPVKRAPAVASAIGHPKPIPAKTVDARAVLAAAEREAAHLARPRPKGPRAGAAKASDDDIGYVPAAWGENRAVPGSRLKGVQKLR